MIIIAAVTVFILFFTSQGIDIILQAEDGFLPTTQTALALTTIAGVMLAAGSYCSNQSAKQDKWAFEFAPIITMAISGLVILLLNGLSANPFGFWNLGLSVLLIPFALLFSIGCAWAMRIPAVTRLFGLSTLLILGTWPAPIGDIIGSALMLALIITGWSFVLIALVHWYRSAPEDDHLFVKTGQRCWIPSVTTFRLLFYVVIPALILLSFFRPSPDNLRGQEAVIKNLIESKHAWSISPHSQIGPTPETAFAEIVKSQSDSQEPHLIVIVAAAGGGIKASYWTSKLLGRVTDREPRFAKSLLVASGVSGGSLGLGVYRALLNVEEPRCKGSAEFGPLERCAEAFHRRDLLAGVIGAMGTTAVGNSLLPVFPHRSVAIEKSWEARWRNTVNTANGTPVDDAFANSFKELWKPGSAVPALIFNTTRAISGDRLPVSNLNLRGVFARPGRCATNIAENLDMPLSTAANASARFPLVEPWGWFDLAQPPDGCRARETVADGGFFDNYGATTALDVYRRVKEYASTHNLNVHIIVIQISSDTDCALAIDLDRKDGKRLDDCKTINEDRRKTFAQRGGSWFSRWFDYQNSIHNQASFIQRQFLVSDPDKPAAPPGILGTLSNAISATGLNTALELRQAVEADGDSFYHFSLGGALDIPLGWALSGFARRQIDAHLDVGENKRELDRLINEWGRSDTAPKTLQAAAPASQPRRSTQNGLHAALPIAR